MKLTRREIQVAEMLANGHGNKHIAYVLGITERTVKAHLFNGMKKVNAKTRAHYAVIVDREVRCIRYTPNGKLIVTS